MTELLIDSRAPDFILEDVNGSVIRLFDFRDKFVVIAALRGFF